MNPFTPRVATVVRREFMMRVKSKWFLISTLGLPVLIVGLGALSLSSRWGGDGCGPGAQAHRGRDPAGLIGDLLIEEFIADELDAVPRGQEEFSVDGARSRLLLPRTICC